MGDTLDEPWWEPREGTRDSNSDLSGDESLKEDAGRSIPVQKCATLEFASSKKRKQPTESHLTAEKEESKDKNETEVKPKRKRKKKISDMIAKSPPKPGAPADLQKLLNEHFGAKRSVIELEELKLPVCPKWAKLRKNHTEKKSVVMLIICSSALRCLELIKSIAAFKGEGKVMKMFAKHIKIQEQMRILEKGIIHIGVGTPGRIKALVEQEGLSLMSLKYLVLDWNWRDQKLRRLVDIPEIRNETIELLEMGLIRLCREGSVKLGLF